MVKMLRLGGSLAVLFSRRSPLHLGRRRRKLSRASSHTFYTLGYMREEIDALRRECGQN